MHRPATLFACRAWVPNPLATSKQGQKAGFFDVDGWISPCSRRGRVVLDEGREGRIPRGFPLAADYNHTSESPPDSGDQMPDPDLLEAWFWCIHPQGARLALTNSATYGTSVP